MEKTVFTKYLTEKMEPGQIKKTGESLPLSLMFQNRTGSYQFSARISK